ncbi:hypothetical protein XENOCAPTIV_003312 [Xenoophorus captivus]|uniref:Uncharacterized protein n=1 Tax=Xenoophorus captivus TaxID=1517983 RepID=A0ABV0QDR0_9TELE
MIMDCRYTVPPHISHACREALESNQYNHITATYFLLAERMLRDRQDKEQHSQTRSPSPSKAQFRPKTALLDLNQRQEIQTPSSSQQLPAQQSQEKSLRPLAKPHSNPLRLGSLGSVGQCKPRSPSLFSVEEDEEEEGAEDKCLPPSALPCQVVLRSKTSCSSSSMSSAGNRMTSRMSAPVLNQIHEEDKEDDEQEESRELHGLGPPKPSLSLNLNSRIPSPLTLMSSPKTPTNTTLTPSSEISDDDTESYFKPHTLTVVGQEDNREERKADREKRRAGQGSPLNCASPGSGSIQGKGTTKAASGLVESLKLMSLCLSSQFHNLTSGGGGVGGVGVDGSGGGGVSSSVGADSQERPMWRMCMGGSTGSLDKVSLLGGPSPKGNLYHQPPLGDVLADPLLDGPCSGTLRLGELDLARENHRNIKNRALQMPLNEKTMSVNIHRSPKEGLLCTPTPHSCCQVI